MKYASFLATTYLTFTNEHCQLQSYWTEFHEIFTRYTGIIGTVNAHIEGAISHSVSECQSDKCGEFAIFCTKSVAMATSIYIEKRGPDRSFTPKNLSFRVKITKISPGDLEIICLREIIKKDKRKKTKQLEMRGKA